MKTEVGPRDRGVQHNPVPNYFGDDPTFTLGNLQTLPGLALSQNQAPITSKSGTVETYEPEKERKKKEKKRKEKQTGKAKKKGEDKSQPQK